MPEEVDEEREGGMYDGGGGDGSGMRGPWWRLS